MPGMPVYQDSPSNLKNQIYASDGNNVINVKADETGRLKIATDTAAPLEVSINEANDSIVVYGNDGTDNKALKTNASGQLDIRPLTAADTVTVAVSEADDSIVVYGNDGTSNKVLKTDGNGVLQVNYTHTFTDQTLLTDAATTNAYQYVIQQDISDMSTYAFFIKNSGATNGAKLQVQLSPNGTDWVNDSDEITLAHSTNTILTANKFLKFIRIGYKSAVDDASTTVTVIFQGQD
ncbi:MAG: hypothetical protein K0S71_1486 [Clostridia bacterium]|jgi:hypothetical protein|nr:hypothetical protein [Clostridia bacterium]